MADNDVVINGDSSDFIDADSSDFIDAFPKTPSFGADSDVSSDLNRRISALESANSKLEKENAESAAKIGELKNELAALRREKENESERADSETRAAGDIAKRASELEGDVFRLQHDLITSMNTGEELSRQISDLNAKIKELEVKANREKDATEALRNEKKVAEDSIKELEAMLEDSYKKVKAMEEKMDDLVKKSAESNKIIGGLVEKVEERGREAIADTGVTSNSSINGLGCLKTQLPLIGAVSAGAVVVAATAVLYIRHTRN